MRIGYKLVLLISAALVLYVISSGIHYVLSRETIESYNFFSTIKDFENGLLRTIIYEKDYSLSLDGQQANDVLAGNEKSSRYLKDIASKAEGVRDFQSLSQSLTNYRQTFEQLVKNNGEISSLKEQLNNSFDNLMADSDQIAGKINTIIGMTLTSGGNADPSLNSLLVASKTIVSDSSELVLTVDRDLLLDNNEKTYVERSGKIAATLGQQSRNVKALVSTMNEAGLKGYPAVINKLIPRLQSASEKIHKLWGQNRQLVLQLNAVRKQIITNDATMMAAVQKRLKRIDENARLFNLAALGLIFLVLITGGTFIGRSITSAIRRVSDQLRVSADWTAMAATQMSSTSHTLAEEASEQAAALEETSSSLEEMASMTRGNARNAQGSNALMKDISRTVEQSNQSMLKLKTSMEDICRSSEETQAIVKTIDEISFQTNLLALNAAVEAARAGEAGAGFAVVADEVRNLAMRAADAAKNTAELIENTVKKVQDGAAVATQAYSEFSNVSRNISKAADLMEEVAQSSQEQAGGAEQINKAVSQMDTVTQHNAASAKESASVCAELSTRAKHMKQLVADLVSLVGGAKESAVARANGPVGQRAEVKRPKSKAGGFGVPRKRAEGKDRGYPDMAVEYRQDSNGDGGHEASL